MGQPAIHAPASLVLVACSRYDAALDWVRESTIRQFGNVALESAALPFEETDYYEASMGPNLKKTMLACENLIAPERLPEIKRQTNEWEAAYAKQGQHPESRPVNVDPGYLTLGKFVLASTKDHSHRIYLDRGIFAEVTLHFEKGKWQHQRWTYPDYRRDDYQAFLTRCREWLRRRLANGGAA